MAPTLASAKSMLSSSWKNEEEDSVPSKAKRSMAHPMDPISADELKLAVSLLKSHNAQIAEPVQALKVTGILLIEPPKAMVMKSMGIAFENAESGEEKTGDLTRRVEIAFVDVSANRAYEARFNLSNKALESWKQLPEHVHPSITADELLSCEKIVQSDPDVQQLCRDVGVDPKDLRCDGWSVGYEPRFSRNRRLQGGMLYVQSKADDNIYSRPLDFVPVVDSNLQKVIRIDFPDIGSERGAKSDNKNPQTVPHDLESNKEGQFKAFHEPEKVQKLGPLTRERIHPPTEALDYLPELAKGSANPIKMKEDLKPLHVVQPEGVSFKINGHNLEWQGWSLHVGWNYREGICLNTIRYEDPFSGETRPLFHRISLAEMVVPYGETAWPNPRKHAFDVGEYGMGMMSNSLALGCDCLGAIHYLDGHIVDTAGNVETIPKCICIHEEDAGLLFKHTDYRPGGRAHAVRARKLVISMVCTVANYEYGIYYSLHQDGTIGLEVKLTGVLNIVPSGPGETSAPFGSIVAPGINAQYHQHLFSLRIDPVIDGLCNSVVQTDVKMLEADHLSPENYTGNGFYTDKVYFDKAAAADWDLERSWSIVNENKKHYASKLPVGYKIMCRDMHNMLIKKGAPVWQRAPFARHHFWVIPAGDESSIEDQRLYPAGKYVPQTIEAPADSVTGWVAQGGEVRNKDIICFLTFGVTHIPRPEDFPVMPVETVSVMLKPVGFFKYNPALGVPSTVDQKSVAAFAQSQVVNGMNANGHSIPTSTNGINGNGSHCCEN